MGRTAAVLTDCLKPALACSLQAVKEKERRCEERDRAAKSHAQEVGGLEESMSKERSRLEELSQQVQEDRKAAQETLEQVRQQRKAVRA